MFSSVCTLHAQKRSHFSLVLQNQDMMEEEENGVEPDMYFLTKDEEADAEGSESDDDNDPGFMTEEDLEAAGAGDGDQEPASESEEDDSAYDEL